MPSPSALKIANYLGWFDDILRQMVTSKSDLFLSVGWHEWSLFAGMAATLFLIRTAVSNRRHGLFDLEGAVLLLGKILLTSGLLSGYAALHQIPLAFTHSLGELVGAGMLSPLLEKAAGIMTGMEKPSVLDWVDIIVYYGTLVEMAVLGLVLFVLNAGSYLAIGMLTVYGPLLIPFLLTHHFSKWFYRWLDMFVSYAMLTPSIMIFTFVWTTFFMKLFETTIMQDLSLAHFAILTGTLLMMVGAFLLMSLKLASFNAELFSGAGGMAASMGASWEGHVRSLVRAVAR